MDSKYRIVSEEERLKYAPEMVGTGHHLLSDKEKFWVVKYKPATIDEEKRDYLAYLLGKGYANIAEVLPLSTEELAEVKALTQKDGNSMTQNTFLVRLAGSYSPQELPCQTLEEAVAKELVFSVWIRRRDAHVDNRVYVSGIPIFFDHQTAFLGEPHLADISAFFGATSDYGQAGRWRVRELTQSLTLLCRGVNKTEMGSFHYVNNFEAFKECLSAAASELEDHLPENWRQVVVNVGFTGDKSQPILDFLEKNLETIESDIGQMKKIIFQ